MILGKDMKTKQITLQALSAIVETAFVSRKRTNGSIKIFLGTFVFCSTFRHS